MSLRALALAAAIAGMSIAASADARLVDTTEFQRRPPAERPQLSWENFQGGCFGYIIPTNRDKRGVLHGDDYVRREFIPLYCMPI
jgi:hypothetical protein